MSEKRKHLTDEEWIPVGQEYCAGIAVNRLSKKYGVSRPAIANAIWRYHWQRDPLLQEAIAGTTAAQMQTAAPEQRAATALRIGKKRAELIGKHQQAWGNVYQIREDAFRLLRGETTQMLAKSRDVFDQDGAIIETAEVLTLTKRVRLAKDLIAIFEADARALMTAQEGERRAYGFDYKTQLENSGIDEQDLRHRRELANNVINYVKELKKLAGVREQSLPQEPPMREGDAT